MKPAEPTYFSYKTGRTAAWLNCNIDSCPYEGNNPGSATLRARWLAGYAYGRDNPKPVTRRRRKNAKRTWRRAIVKQLPRSDYARSQLESCGVTDARSNGK
jgi:hypothetical protein